MNKNRITLINISSTIILQGLAFVSGPVFSAALGTTNYGIAAVYLTWVQLASTIFSLQAVGMLAAAKVNFQDEDQEKYQSSVFSLATISYLCFSVITIVVLALLSKWLEINIIMVLFGLAQGWGLYCVSSMNEKFTYEFKAGRNFLLSVATSVLTIGVSLLLVYSFPPEKNYWGRIIGQSSVYTIIGIILFIYILTKGRTIYNKEYWKFTIPLTIPTIFHLLAYIVLNQSDKVMLQNMVDNSTAGVYALACTFSNLLISIYHAFNNSWVPYYYEYTKHNQIDRIHEHSKNYIELFTILTIGFMFLSKEVFHIYADGDFWAGTEMIPLFSIGNYFVFLYSFAVNFEFYNKKTKTIALGTSLAAVSNIILNFILIYVCGMLGAVIATALSHGLQFGFHYLSAMRIKTMDFPYHIKDFLPGFASVCLAATICFVTQNMWFIRWGIGAILGIYLLSKIIRRREIF